MPMKTRERILVAARRMFNERGYGNVTTALLAEEVGISEGNLWYHFNSKRALLEAISNQFMAYISERLKITPRDETKVIEEYIQFLAAYAQELREFRFMYRDHADYGEHSDALLEHIPDFYWTTQNQLQSFYEVMVRNGKLDWPDERLTDLALNAKIIVRYGLEYKRETGQLVAEGSGAVQQAFAQHLTLFEHKLTPEAAVQLREYLSVSAKPQSETETSN